MKQMIIDLLSEVTENEDLKNTVTDDTNISEDINLDSLQMINFILRIEEESGIEIDFETFDFSNLESVKKFSGYLEEQKKKLRL